LVANESGQIFHAYSGQEQVQKCLKITKNEKGNGTKVSCSCCNTPIIYRNLQHKVFNV
jgi:hypothetical protein